MQLHDLLDGLELLDPEPSGPARAAEATLERPPFEVRGDPRIDVLSVVHDSRAVQPGALFCSIPGATADGHDFAPAAVSAGAVACLVERWIDVDATLVRTPSVRAAIGPLSSRFFDAPSRALRVIGVTGTNGKTSTTYLLESIARVASVEAGVIGTTGARIGREQLDVAHTTPEATDLQQLLARMRAAGVETVAMEVSSHALDQQRVDGTWFSAVCFTNLTHDHLDYHPTLDAYFDAKARLFTRAFSDRAAICVDDEPGRRLAERARANGLEVCTFATTRAADVRAHDIELSADHSTFVLDVRGERARVHLGLVGGFNVTNALAAAATAHIAGFEFDAIRAGLDAAGTVPGRMEHVDAGQPFSVLVDYAHTPAALESVLDAARGFASRDSRVLVVFGCGGDRDRAKRAVMGSIASRRSDVAYLTSDNPRSEDPVAIAAEVQAGVVEGERPLVVELDRRRAIRAAVRDARPGDVVVIAGKGHELGQTANGVTVPFDDRAVAREELGSRA